MIDKVTGIGHFLHDPHKEDWRSNHEEVRILDDTPDSELLLNL
jgi:hypothetical protein